MPIISRLSRALCGVLLAAGLVRPADGADSVDHGAALSGNVDVVGRFAQAEPSGIALLPDGRLVLSFPTSAQDHPGPRLATWMDGRLLPFPSAAAQRTFLSPLGMTRDARGRLWVVDEGMVAGVRAAPRPALIGIDPASGALFARIALHAPAVRPDSHVNDVRVDLTHGAAGTAYLSDTSQAGHPALIVVDLARGQARRVLADRPCVSAEPGFAMEVDGRMARYDLAHPAMGQGGVNGIALDRDASRLYWAPLSSRRLYSAPTALLADPAVTDDALERAVRDEGEAGVADGMATARDGSLYITDIERHGVLRRTPDGRLFMVVHDPRLIAPDSLALDGDVLWMTVGQWSRLPVFHGGRDMQERPYLLVRIAPVAP
ncbi:gluconolactonase [Gluconacetobacter johannae DSM 13595]|uniref:Gluconolactonase n=1 Tax=Gluconacetobacter johannae TaxID=112140 RepID=A0A7W4J8Y3_9PROT|nr:L-dopachrome tautomerase-related protein [Gluconacetobacter johannae]MBB2176859.1 gluconolactonase [Gluconacetobacter johannae]GBQ86407.1 gluconolactonase [Gluconacetobacter johannae DSM 13595]